MVWTRARSGTLSPRNLQQVHADAEILTLHNRGLTYNQIVERTSYTNPSGPQKAVQRALTRVPHRDLALDARIEYLRLEAIHQALWAEFDNHPSSSREAQLMNRICAVSDLQSRLTANGNVDFPPVRRRSPHPPTGTWTKLLRRRAGGATLDQLAARFGYADRSGARKQLVRDLNDYCAEPADDYRDKLLLDLDALQESLWEAATSTPPSLRAVDAVLKIIGRRIRLLGLAPDDPTRTKPKRRRQGRTTIPPLTGREAIHNYQTPGQQPA